jgi:hypothetical protein
MFTKLTKCDYGMSSPVLVSTKYGAYIVDLQKLAISRHFSENPPARMCIETPLPAGASGVADSIGKIFLKTLKVKLLVLFLVYILYIYTYIYIHIYIGLSARNLAQPDFLGSHT